MLYKLTPEELNTVLKNHYKDDFEGLDVALIHTARVLEGDISETLASLGIVSKVVSTTKSGTHSISRRKMINPDPTDLLDIKQLMRDYMRAILNKGVIEISLHVQAIPELCEEGKVKAINYIITWY